MPIKRKEKRENGERGGEEKKWKPEGKRNKGERMRFCMIYFCESSFKMFCFHKTVFVNIWKRERNHLMSNTIY